VAMYECTVQFRFLIYLGSRRSTVENLHSKYRMGVALPAPNAGGLCWSTRTEVARGFRSESGRRKMGESKTVATENKRSRISGLDQRAYYIGHDPIGHGQYFTDKVLYRGAKAYRHAALGIKEASIRIMRGKGGFLQRNVPKESPDVMHSTLWCIAGNI
jgi:hypothetical protein